MPRAIKGRARSVVIIRTIELFTPAALLFSHSKFFILVLTPSIFGFNESRAAV